MAEDKQQNLTGVNIITSGQNWDDSPLSVPQGDYTYALNLGMQNLSGTANQATNYPGNQICVTLTSGLYIIGSKRINTGHIIFSCDLAGTISQIGLLQNCAYTILVNDNCLGFRITNQIQAEYKETYNCGRKVYWTDNLNARRFLDIDHIPYNNLPTLTIDCDATLVQPNVDYPCVWYYEIQETGGLHAGMYKPYIQYADVNGIGYGDWFESIGNIPIFKDPVNSNFNSLQGSPSNEPTTKSINFLLSNIDTSYTHINIGVLTTHAGILAAYKVATIPSTSTEFLLTGLGTAYIDLTLDELLKQSTIYKKAKTVCQSNGYLLWGNLSGRKDPNFQPIANDIQVTWQVYKTPAYFTSYDYKNPYSTTFKKGYMRDEVYALGIRLVYKDGSKSCAYHIPGRELNFTANGTPIPTGAVDQYGNTLSSNWDDTPITASNDTIDGANLPRWKNYNTGINNGLPAGYISEYAGKCAESGEMSYWESILDYPSTVDENGVLIYPNVAGVMDKIRHHKMPDCSVIPLFDDAVGTDPIYSFPYLNYLGLNIDNVNIDFSDPDYSDVVGWELVVGDRTNNKSIIAKGILYNTWNLNVSEPTDYTGGTNNERDYTNPSHFIATDIQYNTFFNAQTGMFNDLSIVGYKFMDNSDRDNFAPVFQSYAINKDQFTFYSPDTSFKKSNLAVQELKIEKEFDGDWRAIQSNNLAALTGDTYLGSYYRDNQPQYNNIRRTINPGAITYNNDNSVVSDTNFTNTLLSNVKNESNVWIQVTNNINNCLITDNSLSNNALPGMAGTFGECIFLMPTNPNIDVFDGGGGLNLVVPPNPYQENLSGVISSYYGAIKLIQLSQYGQLDDISYLSTGTCPITNTYEHCLFGGDTFLSNYTYHRSRRYEMWLPEWGGYDNYLTYTWNPGGGLGCAEAEYPTAGVAINNTWVESSINTELRTQGTGVLSWDKFYPYGGTQATGFYGTNWGTAQWAYDILNIGVGFSNINDNYVGYNFDYSAQNIGKQICYQSLEDRTDCEPHYKTRVIYTLRSQEESKQDYWLVERPNDSYDFPKKSGELWDMRELGQDKVLFRFENGIYAYPAYDTLETDANTIQLGTGGMFAQDPKELITTDTGYGGTRSQWAINSTEFGHFFLDDKRGAVFNLQGQINPISNVKMFNFFSKELKLKLLDYYPTFANYDNPANPEGIGFNSVFDDRFKIWLLTKKDYIPKLDANGLPLTSYQDGKFYRIGARLEEVSITDDNYFCNKSYTIGYSAKYNRWISFYSFIPMNYLSSDLGFFSTLDNKIWQHHSDKFCTYYDETFDHIIEYIVKLQGEVTNKSSIQFITNCYQNDGYEVQFETFKNAIVYNNEGCTGMLNLVIPDNNNLATLFNLPQINASSIDISLEKAGKCIYKFNHLWNYVSDRRVNNPIFLPSCEPSIDKELNQSCISYTKPWNQLARLDSQWCKVRLFYDNPDLNLVSTLFINKNTSDYF